MNSKEERRWALDVIGSLEGTVRDAQQALNITQHDYLIALGFTHEFVGSYTPIDLYYYEDEVFIDIDRALEYADEHI